MEPYSIFVQSVALVAVAAQALSFHAQTRRSILGLQIVGISIWVIHFLLLSAWTGAFINIINVLITVAFVFKNEKEWIKNKYFFILSLVALVAATIAGWQGSFSIFALGGVSLMTFAKWQDEPTRIRLIAIAAGFCWIAYDAFAGSYGGIMAEMFIQISVIMSIARHNKKQTL